MDLTSVCCFFEYKFQGFIDAEFETNFEESLVQNVPIAWVDLRIEFQL